jgi:hypothetical protein
MPHSAPLLLRCSLVLLCLAPLHQSTAWTPSSGHGRRARHCCWRGGVLRRLQTSYIDIGGHVAIIKPDMVDPWGRNVWERESMADEKHASCMHTNRAPLRNAFQSWTIRTRLAPTHFRIKRDDGRTEIFFIFIIDKYINLINTIFICFNI